MNPLQELDNVLTYLQNNSTYEFQDLTSVWLGLAKDHLKVTHEHIPMIMEKLHKDGYVYKHKAFEKDDSFKSFDMYKISFDGMYFLESIGGYEKQRELNAIVGRIKNNREKHLVYGTWGVAIGATSLVIWEIYKTFFLHLR